MVSSDGWVITKDLNLNDSCSKIAVTPPQEVTPKMEEGGWALCCNVAVHVRQSQLWALELTHSESGLYPSDTIAYGFQIWHENREKFIVKVDQLPNDLKLR